MPRHDGADYEMLCRFDQGKTSESFYLHYPWLFSIDIVKQLLQGTVNQEADEAAVHQIANFMQTSQENDIALDQHVRSVRSELWNWQTVQEHVRIITELMITRARHSQDLYRLALQFCELINQDIIGSMFSGGSQMDERQPPVSGSANIYDLHIQMQLRDQAFTTRNELNQLSKIFSRYFQEQENRWRRGITGSVGNPSPLVKYLHLLSMEVDVRARKKCT